MMNMQRKQIVVIHGGEAFDTYEEYLEYLRMCPYDPFEVRVDGWKENLPQVLGNDFEVIAPLMPSGLLNAKFEEWSIWFEKLIPYLRDDAIFIGHSLGANFLAKYFSLHDMPKKVGDVYLIAGCFGWKGGFELPESLQKFSDQAASVVIFHSRDDEIAPFSDAEKYQSAIEGSEIIAFEDRGHFNRSHPKGADLPELVEMITVL